MQQRERVFDTACSRDSSSACLSDRPRGLTHLLLPDIVRAFQTCLYSTAKRQITDQAVIITWGTEALEDHRLDLFFCLFFVVMTSFSCYLDKTKAVSHDHDFISQWSRQRPCPKRILHVHLRSYGLTMAAACALSPRDRRRVSHSSL